jgi:hypothetical protein
MPQITCVSYRAVWVSIVREGSTEDVFCDTHEEDASQHIVCIINRRAKIKCSQFKTVDNCFTIVDRWMGLAQDRVQWRAEVLAVFKLRVLLSES